NYEGIEAEGVFVNAAIFQGEGGRLAVGDHYNLAPVFFLTKQDALGHTQGFSGVGVVGADLHASEFAEGDFFGAVVEEDEIQSVAGILRANEMRKGHGYALGGSEAVFAVEDHAVAAIEQDYGCARAVVFTLMDHQVRVGDFDGNFAAVAADGVKERFANVEIERVAKFVLAGDAAGFNSGGQIASVVATEAAAT